MNDPMRILKADHRVVDALLSKLADTDEGAKRAQLLDEVVMKLTAHMDLEESIVYPVVAEQLGADDEEEAEIEHQLVRETIAKLQAMVDVPGFGAVVEMLRAGVKHHVQEEESEILPELKETLERADWVAMGDAIAETKQATGMPIPAAVPRRSSKRASRASSKRTAAPSKRATSSNRSK